MNSQKEKHLDYIQVVISRMASNSFFLKGWSVTLVAAIFALAAKDENHRFLIVTFIPVFIFWILDGYFLWQEELFRNLYDKVAEGSIDSTKYTMNVNLVPGKKPSWFCASFSKTLLIFYGTFFALLVLVDYFAWL